MNNQALLEARTEEVGRHLDKLAARSTRLIGEFRSQSKSILVDLAAWRTHLEQLRADVELAGMDVGEELPGLRATIRGRSEGIDCRLEQSRVDSAAAWRALRAGMDEALCDFRTVLDPIRVPVHHLS